MLRCSGIRNYIQEIAESQTFEKLSFFPPFIILLVELILLFHALEIQVLYVIELTIILVVLSIVEIFFVMTEIHEHYTLTNFDRLLTIKLDDFILDHRYKNVQIVVTRFIDKHPEYRNDRNKIYHIACQILETHKEELLEHDLEKDLHKFLKSTKKTAVDDILNAFLKKHTKYKPHAAKIYKIICSYLEKNNSTRKNN